MAKIKAFLCKIYKKVIERQIMLDIVIIGSGPAGLSAAIYGSRSGLDVLVIEKISHGVGQIAEADCINNYLGFSSIRGFELGMQFRTHAEACGVRFQESEAIKLERTDACWKIYAKDGSCIQSKTVIYAAGASHRHLNVFGEEALIGKGVSYCATCDGMFYKDKRIAVICNDKKYEHEVKYLADLAAEVLYFPAYNDSEIELPNVKISKDAPIALIGDSFVEGITLRSGKTESVDGVFCLRNAIAPSKLMPQLEIENGHILVDRAQQTNVAGCFAAGDCTGRPYQYTKAVGEGNVAAHSCIQYLSKSEK